MARGGKVGTVPNQCAGSGLPALFYGMARRLPERLHQRIPAPLWENIVYPGEISRMWHKWGQPDHNSMFIPPDDRGRGGYGVEASSDLSLRNVVGGGGGDPANSRYVAYGGAFVLFYMLVILYQRYFKTLYCLYPVEWYAPEHTWVLGDTGVVLLLAGMILLIGVLYYEILGRCIKHV